MTQADPVDIASEPGRRPGRRGLLLIVVATAVAVALLVAAVDVGYGMTEPLEDGSVASSVRVCDAATTPPDCAPVEGAVLTPGTRFQLLRSVRNTGVAPITILGLQMGLDATFEWLPPATIKQGHEYLEGPDDIEDLAPVTLASDEELTVLIRGRVRDCAVPLPAPDTIEVDGLSVGFRLIALEHTQWVPAQNAGPLSVPFNPCLDTD